MKECKDKNICPFYKFNDCQKHLYGEVVDGDENGCPTYEQKLYGFYVKNTKDPLNPIFVCGIRDKQK